MKSPYLLPVSLLLSGCTAMIALGERCESKLSVSYYTEERKAAISMDGALLGREWEQSPVDVTFILSGCFTDGCTPKVIGGKHPAALRELMLAVRKPCHDCTPELWLPAVSAEWPDGTTVEIEAPIVLHSARCGGEVRESVRIDRE